jgi:hypothetical protein
MATGTNLADDGVEEADEIVAGKGCVKGLSQGVCTKGVEPLGYSSCSRLVLRAPCLNCSCLTVFFDDT